MDALVQCTPHKWVTSCVRRSWMGYPLGASGSDGERETLVSGELGAQQGEITVTQALGHK
ncbi:hypothetical protein GCM10027271_48660 [Saccharopolyspora gloriosae]